MSTARTPRILTAPEAEPLTLDECRQHLRVDSYTADDSDSDTLGQHPDDTLIMALQAAAREYCEDFTGLSFSSRTLEIALDAWPTVAADGSTAIELPGGPVREIVRIEGGEPASDSDSDTVFELDPAAYLLDVYRQPNRIVPVSAWPSVGARTNSIKISYIAGYGDTADGDQALPGVLRSALLLVLGHLYEHREDNVATALQSIPLGAEALMRPRRIRLGMA